MIRIKFKLQKLELDAWDFKRLFTLSESSFNAAKNPVFKGNMKKQYVSGYNSYSCNLSGNPSPRFFKFCPRTIMVNFHLSWCKSVINWLSNSVCRKKSLVEEKTFCFNYDDALFNNFKPDFQCREFCSFKKF